MNYNDIIVKPEYVQYFYIMTTLCNDRKIYKRHNILKYVVFPYSMKLTCLSLHTKAKCFIIYFDGA